MRGLTLSLLLSLSITALCQAPYGNNPSAGGYVNVGDAKLYYEIYGTGKPFVMLHGGVYGSIGEFEPFIGLLSKHYQVICIATRGHGKSELGKGPMTWKQRADDAYKVIRAITKDSVTVLGFSDGGYSAYKLAAEYPSLVKRMIVIGAADRTAKRDYNYTPEQLLGQSKDFFEKRLALMPEPKRWGEALGYLNKLYNEDLISAETFSKIQCPTLVMAGDRDEDHPVELVTAAARNIKGSQLSIIPGCHHVVFFCNFPALWEGIKPFLNIKD